MKHVLTYFFIALCFLLRSQIYQPIRFPEKVDKKYLIDPIADEEKYRKKIAKKVPARHLKPFTYSCAFSKSEMFKGGKIYLNWPGLETYLNQLLDSILPGNLKTKKIRVFVGRSSEMNAFCLYDGTMIVNVGLVAEVKNEAALVAIMGHELGHFAKNHVLNEYVESVKKKKKDPKMDELALAIKRRGYSQQLELEADEMGYTIARDAGYDVAQANFNFELFIREKEYYRKRNESELVTNDSVKVETKSGTYTANSLEKLLRTHPDEKARQEKLAAFLKSNPGKKNKINKMGQDLFASLQKQARLESISLIFSEHEYSECLERSLRFYLFQPDELTYSYYVAESIRRLCLMDYTLRKKGLLTEKMLNSTFSEGQGILHDLKYLIPNDEQYAAIKATDLNNPAKIPFETYKEAFYYFDEKLIKKDFSEAHLMAALFENNKSKRQKSVDKYLAHPKAQRKDFAKNYLDNTLNSKVSSNAGELVMIPQVDYYSHARYTQYGSYGRTRYNYAKSETVGSELAKDISTALTERIPNTQAIALPQASIDNFNTKEKYEEMIQSALMARREENEGYNVTHYYKELEDEDYIGKVDIFRLNPEIWDFFVSNKISTITFAKYTRHISDHDKLLRRPGLYLGIPTLGFTWLFLPLRTAHLKKLDVYAYDSKAEEGLVFREVKHYRLTPKKAVKMFKRMRKDRAEFIKDSYAMNP